VNQITSRCKNGRLHIGRKYFEIVNHEQVDLLNDAL